MLNEYSKISAEGRKAPLVSVAVPVKNAENFIAEAIESVLNQTFIDLELIIINDGSTDGTEQVVRELLARRADNRARFFTRENRGVSRTLNEALTHSSGRYFTYLGADDIWDSDKTEIQIDELEKTGFAAAFSDCWVINENGKILCRYGDQFPYHGGKIYEDVVWGRFQPASPTVLFRRDAIDSVGGFVDEHIFEDRDLWVRISRDFHVAYVDKPLAYYRVHETNSSKNLEGSYWYARDVAERAIKADPELESSRRRLMADIDAFQAAAHCENLQLSDARRFASKALVQNPTNRLAWRTFVLSFLGKSLIRRIRDKRRRGYAASAASDHLDIKKGIQ